MSDITLSRDFVFLSEQEYTECCYFTICFIHAWNLLFYVKERTQIESVHKVDSIWLEDGGHNEILDEIA
jgi:hypothetical protein